MGRQSGAGSYCEETKCGLMRSHTVRHKLSHSDKTYTSRIVPLASVHASDDGNL